MTRRSLIAMITGGAAAALAPEELLWTPGKKLISIPKVVHVPQWRELTQKTMYVDWCNLCRTNLPSREVSLSVAADYLAEQVYKLERETGRRAVYDVCHKEQPIFVGGAYKHGYKLLTTKNLIAHMDTAYDVANLRTLVLLTARIKI